MSELRPIDVSTWNRAEHFAHFLDASPCTYSVTVELDTTELDATLRAEGRRRYPAQIWALTTIVNRIPEFRTTVLDDGSPAIWDALEPSFASLDAERETFSALWTPYDADFRTFHDAVLTTIAEHGSSGRFVPQQLPPNAFDVSSIPWLRFSAFDLDVQHGYRHLAPIFTLGKSVERAGRTTVPLALRVHHAAVDGLHVARFVDALQQLVAQPDWVR
ncbi:chloramphenicol acetyltransferase CAT [Schumannella luteola]|uniref:Chloramphenicol O-acetyltransferase type A n=1 Tax=Schumannella luteola TaxID=472059 RepID=A0A852YGY0_9MICO|nr:CatA-like O-acetyltransferase [Schumannella luteola]NYH00551.1 chloramphenicol O-acetyltransferase type A [Schumannella luteola]